MIDVEKYLQMDVNLVRTKYSNWHYTRDRETGIVWRNSVRKSSMQISFK